MDLKPIIKDEAYKLGFTLAGFTHPGPPSSYPVFSDWIGRGNHAGMHYLASHRSLECRKNPAALLPGCRSILVLGLPYSNPLLEIQNYLPSFSGRIAAYAWGRDYHNLIPTRLEKLAMRISELTKMPVNAKGFTDTSPILEHDLARDSITRLLVCEYGVRPERAEQTVRAILAGPRERELLGLPEPSAVLGGERTTFLADGQVIEYSSGVYCGDWYTLRFGLDPAGIGV